MSAKVVEPCSVRLKKALAMRNMRQADLCEKTKIPKSAISHYLSGSFVPKQDRAFIIAQALDVNPAWLMGFDAPMDIEDIQKIPPTEPQLSEGEKLVLDLFRQIPEDKQTEALDLLRVALRMQKKP